jgi:hypothetical protein
VRIFIKRRAISSYRSKASNHAIDIGFTGAKLCKITKNALLAALEIFLPIYRVRDAREIWAMSM